MDITNKEHNSHQISPILENLPMPAILLDFQGRIKATNSDFDDLLNYASGELMAKHIDTIIDGADDACRSVGLADVIQNRRVSGLHVELLTKGGQKVDASLCGAPVEEDSAGDPGALYVVTDMGGTRRMLNELSRSIVENIPAGILVLDENLSVRSANNAFLEMFQTKFDLIAEKQVREIFPDDFLNRGGIREMLAHVVKTGESASISRVPLSLPPAPKRRGDKTSPLSRRESVVNLMAVGLNATLGGCMFLIDDVTSEHKREEHMRESEKLAEVGRLAAGLAHEIGNPIGVISASAQLCLDDPTISGGLKEHFAIIRESAKAVDGIVKQLMDFAAPTDSAFEVCDIVAVIMKSCSLLRYRFRKLGITVLQKFAPDTPKILADGKQIEQLFFNIILNAVQAMSGPGTLQIETAHDPEQNRTTVSFEDTGPGIPREHLDRIFEPFFSTRHDGTGLGLSICRRIADVHQGTITAENKEEGGARIVVTLPKMPIVDYDHIRCRR